MSGKYQVYPKYRTSIDSWLGDIPIHWRDIQVKRIARVDNSGSYGEDVGVKAKALPVATTAQISSKGTFDIRQMPIRSFSYEDILRYGCNPGDILIVKSSGSAANIISGKAGLVGAETQPFVYSNFLMRLVPDTSVVDPRFLYALIVSSVTRERVQRMVSATTYPNLKVSEYVNAIAPLPPLSEQTQIANFLDYETAKIDSLIEKQQQLIALLKEKRQAVISHAVTKGLNPDAPMRDSGVEWLGEVPAHWEVVRSKRFFPESKKRAQLEDEQLTASQEWGVILQEEFIHRTGRRVVQLNQHFDKRKRVECDDFIISMRSFQGGLERAWVSGGIRSSYVVLKPSSKAYVGYFQRLFKSEQYIQALQGTANFIRDGQDLSYRNFSLVDLPFPPMMEQKKIAIFLESETVKIDSLIEKSVECVDLLEERRTALISAAVTGKIDVREWKAPESKSEEEAV